MDVTGYTGQGTGGGRGKKERSSEQEYKDKSNYNLLGPQMAVGSRCLSSFKTKIPNIVLSLEHVRV